MVLSGSPLWSGTHHPQWQTPNQAKRSLGASEGAVSLAARYVKPATPYMPQPHKHFPGHAEHHHVLLRL